MVVVGCRLSVARLHTDDPTTLRELPRLGLQYEYLALAVQVPSADLLHDMRTYF